MNGKLPGEVEKYLRKYSLHRWTLEWDERNYINAAVVIPAIKEFENVKRLLHSLSENDPRCLERSLIIFVINNFVSSESGIKEENIHTLDYLRKKKGEYLNIALVDASSKGMEMPDKGGGVGLARKIGMDLALKAFDHLDGSKKIIISLDADCTVEKNYLSEIFKYFNGGHSGAAVIKYRHEPTSDAGQNAAIIFYEIFLRYYVLGLRYAGSPYSFHTIGSAFACDYESYIKAEGMNKRKAAEDFYFLQKAAKNAGIGRINTTAVYPASRVSWRVPFGTGAKVSQFKSTGESYLLYDPAVFRILKDWLAVFHNNEILDAGQYLRSAEKINKRLFKYLSEQNFKKDFENILKNSPAAEQLGKQKKIWFDGFRTLKLIHYLRDNGYPMIKMSEALDIFLNWMEYRNKPMPSKKSIPPLEVQKEYLDILRSLDEKID
ncbi:MAG TPA: hypothetical protein VMT35_14380 [Ignavibacteriaceae bacterium]|nr:hypothetical protein [Ignavibacteriaceae bacterium]